jgi:hypothetical protein
MKLTKPAISRITIRYSKSFILSTLIHSGFLVEYKCKECEKSDVKLWRSDKFGKDFYCQICTEKRTQRKWDEDKDYYHIRWYIAGIISPIKYKGKVYHDPKLQHGYMFCKRRYKTFWENLP